MTITLGMMTGENHLLAETPDAVLNPAGAEAEAMEIRPAKKRTPVDQQQLNRIKSVTEPFGNDTKPAENKPKGGIWSKITSIFGKD